MDFFSIKNIMVTLLGNYSLSWIEAIGTVFGLLCIWYASKEKIINYLLGLINVTLFAAIFFQIQLYASLLLQLFFFIANIYGWYAWSRQNEHKENTLKIRWLPRKTALICLIICCLSIYIMTLFIDPLFVVLTHITVQILEHMGIVVPVPTLKPDAFPFWDSALLVLSIAAMILMTRKYIENWLLWVVIDVISVVIYAIQEVYFMSLEYMLLTAIAISGTIMWIKSARKNAAPAVEPQI